MRNCRSPLDVIPAFTRLVWFFLALGLLLVCRPAGAHAQADEAAPATVVSFLIEGEVLNGRAGNAVLMLESFANAGVKLAETKLEAKGDKLVFTLAGNVPAPGLYYIVTAAEGVANPSPAPVLLARGASFLKAKLVAGGQNQLQLEGSELNAQYQRMLLELQTARSTIHEKFATQKPTAELQGQMASKYQQEERSILARYAQAQTMVGTVARLMLMEDITTDPAQVTESASHFWRGIDLSDGALGYYPMLLSRMAYFANALLTQAGMEAAQAQVVLDKLVAQAPKGSRTELALLMGSAAGVQAESPALFVHFGAQAGIKHPTQPLAKTLADAVAQTQAELTSPIAIGKTAPDISLPDVNGTLRKLSELKGKYVLVDFWASWCGPCRMENPNVKKAYAQYAAKGFEIFGVSIDENREAWLKAIQADGITWPQVLSPGWQSATAKLYGVQSIPHTLLLDKQGNILARNLRGPQLTARLKKLMP